MKQGNQNINRFFLCITCFVLSISRPALSQISTNDSINFSGLDFQFVEYLITNKEYKDAILILNDSKKIASLNQNQEDSIHYYSAWAYYNSKILDSSIKYFEKISPESPFYVKSKFYQIFEQIYLGRYDDAERLLLNFEPTDSLNQELKLFQQSSAALLKRKLNAFDSLSNKFRYNNFACENEQRYLFKRKDEIIRNKKKSPFVAGLLSTVVPGTGKFYAGLRGQAISGMIPTFLFAIAGAESYYRSGPKSAGFIIAASFFTIFYVGNIWGSTLSVKTFYERTNNEIHNNILLDLHIPLRRIFGN
jgi:hypothetical protein